MGTHSCLPQAIAGTPQLIKASHWQKYLGDIKGNYILTGLTVSAGAGLNFNVTSGRAYVGGIDIELDVNETNQGSLTANATNYIYAQLTFDGNGEPSGWQYVSNTTGTPPSNAILLGVAQVGASTVSSVSTSVVQTSLLLKDFSVTNVTEPQSGTTTVTASNVQVGSVKAKDGTLAYTVTPSTAALNFQNNQAQNCQLVDPGFNFLNRTIHLSPANNNSNSATTGSGSVTVQAGAVLLQTGTTSGSSSRWQSFNSNCGYIQGGTKKFEASIKVTLNVDTNAKVEIGLSDSGNNTVLGASANKYTFVYDPGTSANWIIRCSNGTTQSSTTTSYAVATSEYDVFAITYDGTTASFYLSGVKIGTLNSNTASLSGKMGVYVSVISASTTNESVYYGGGIVTHDLPGSAPVVVTSGVKGGMLIPLYIYPTDNAWQRVKNAKQSYPSVSQIAVANPDSGPGSGVNSDYTTGINMLNSAGVIVCGYVWTGGGSIPLATVESQIDNWCSWYPNIQGIFFDGMANDAGGSQVSYYQTLTNYVHSTKGKTYAIGNPGTNTTTAYADTVDIVIIWEDYGYPTLSNYNSGPDWRTYTRTKLAMLPHTVSSFDSSWATTATSTYIYWLYATNDTMNNPWDTLAPFYENIVAFMAG